LSEEAQLDVLVATDDDFFLTCKRVVSESANTMDVATAIEVVNSLVLRALEKLHMSAIRQRKLYVKWALYGDRDEYLPPPLLTHGRGRILAPTSEVYTVQHNPNGRYMREFQDRISQRRPYSQFPMFNKVMAVPCHPMKREPSLFAI
jgi:hypothetical protein